MKLKHLLYSSVPPSQWRLLPPAFPDRERLSRRQSPSTTTTSAAWSAAPNGPEAGVWVIAETTDLPTKFAKMVVTDDQGRYVIPDLPKAKYKVWVRGYGLVDSPKVRWRAGPSSSI